VQYWILAPLAISAREIDGTYPAMKTREYGAASADRDANWEHNGGHLPGRGGG
jgi:hypothetical protein